MIDRFTNQAVVIQAPSKVKGGAELQLPSMNALTNKTSSQAFFLRVLKVIIQLRDAALQSMKKSKLGMFSHKNSQITIFGHKLFRQKIHEKYDIFTKKF